LKIATFRTNGAVGVGEILEDRGVVVPFDIPAQDAARGVLSLIGQDTLPGRKEPVSLSDVTLLAPVPRPVRNIFCVGKNYMEHAHEFSKSGFDSSAAAGAVPKNPIIFSKVPETVVAHESDVLIDSKASQAVDYEAELAVIIGKGGRAISPEDAYDHVWGYTIVNDVTARDLQGKYSQWLIGK